MPEVISKNKLHEKIMKDTTKGEPLTVETYNTNKNMFRHITKAGQYFQDAMYIYMADFYSGYGKAKAIN